MNIDSLNNQLWKTIYIQLIIILPHFHLFLKPFDSLL